jgi:NADH-quinone oxidoreductase subunit F
VLFRSLAADLGERVIAVVLFGTGSNGTDGLKEVRAAGGLILVQDPQTAKFEGMPRSAIAAGMADHILAPDAMPAVLGAYFRNEYIAHIRDHHCEAGVCASLMYAPCTNACPAGVNVPSYMALVAKGRYEDALRVHLKANPLPSVCGRVCPQWCIKKCRRADLEGPLAVRLVKRFMSDQRKDYSDLYPEKAPDNGKRVAIIGSGPTGLTAAYYLTLMGYRTTVFDRQPEPGGMLRYAIPEYRLPREYVDKEIAGLVGLGVEIRTGVNVGRDITLGGLRAEGFESIFLACGSGQEIRPDIPGMELPGVYTGIDFLERVAKGEKLQMGPDVVVVGGGDSAIDASRVARRRGAHNITILYRRTRSEMPTNPIEIHEAEIEGNKVEFLTNIGGIVARDDGRLEVEIRKMRLGAFDKTGRRRPEEIPNAKETRVVDNVIIAIGQRCDVGDLLSDGQGLVSDGWGGIKADLRTGATDAPFIFAGGDLVSGAATVVEAISAGQIGARAIDQYLLPNSGRIYPWENPEAPEAPVDTESEIETIAPVEQSLLSAEERLITMEVERTIRADEARCEAGRCLRCDYKG